MIPGLTESYLTHNATAQSIARGASYFRAGAARTVVRRGFEMQALVEGSTYQAYRVSATYDDAGITSATCTCPYDGFGWCKHIIAVLLTCIRDPESVEEGRTVAEMLANMNREQLAELLESMAANDPLLVDRIERASQPAGVKAGARDDARVTAVDQRSVKRRMDDILHSLDGMRPSRAYWEMGNLARAVELEIERARTYTRSDDGINALLYLEAIAEVYVRDWTSFDDSDGELSEVFSSLGDAFAEALLTADLTPDEAADWAEKLEEWQDELDDYGVDNVFETAIAAVEKGWNDPQLIAILRGEALVVEPRLDDDDWYRGALTAVRLRILERREQYDEYLRLAQAEGFVKEHTLMHARLGRIEEAVDRGLKLLTMKDQAFELARMLREKGYLDDALRIGEHGLTLPGQSAAPLAAWVSEVALGLGQTERALAAALVAVRDRPTLVAYRQVEELSGDQWPNHRTSLLDHVRDGNGFSDDRVEIFLKEGLVEEAMAVVDRSPHSYDLLRVVVTAARDEFPEWVIRVARREAEPIMDQGHSAAYHHAVDWLVYLRDAYKTMGADGEWREYVASLREKHGRKYKLMGMMRERL